MSELFTPAAVSVSELNALAKNLLEDHFSGLWVTGEVSNLTRAASGHYYFSLKDNRAQIRCVMFKGTAAKLTAPVKEGDHIELSGKISIYEARGEFQITVNDVRLKGLGRLYEAYEKLKAQLQAEGLFAAERKKTIPPRPKTIGIVTSLAAAALRDVVSTLKRRAPEIPIIIYPAAVQGAGSAQQIADAVQTAAARNETDVLIICRGGGSIEDLWSFNEEPVVRAIAACTLPTISGVGHETDFTLTDFVADLRAPTPTGAAELASPNRAESLHKLQQTRSSLINILAQRYYDASQKTDWLARQIRHPQQKLETQQTQLSTLGRNLDSAIRRHHRFHQQQLANHRQNLHHAKPDTATEKQNLKRLHTALRSHWHILLTNRMQELEGQSALLQAVSPRQILERGFAVVTNSRGQVVRSAAALKQGQKLQITFADGETGVQVCGGQAQQDLFDV